MKIVALLFAASAAAPVFGDVCGTFPCAPVDGKPVACRGDGYCDTACNDAENEYDGGDCCDDTCKSTDEYNCGESHRYVCHDPNAGVTDLLRLDYTKHTLWLDCAKRQSTRYHYTLERDTADHKASGYFVDPNTSIPQNCQQRCVTSNSRDAGPGRRCNGFRFAREGQCPDGLSTEDGRCFDQGHLVMKEHLDSSRAGVKESNYVTNLVPQQSALNQKGAWRQIEDMAMCYADSYKHYSKVDIVGGSVFTSTANDYFNQADRQGVPTPDFFWKVLIRYPQSGGDPDIIGYWFPNEYVPLSPSLIRSVNELRDLSGDGIAEIPERLSDVKPARSWPVWPNCAIDKGPNHDGKIPNHIEL